MQSYIGELPDGVYEAVDWLDNDGIIDDPLKLVLKIRVARNQMTLDFSGSSPACLGPVNISRSTTIAACYVAMKHVFPEVPANSGVLDSIKFIIPEESILSVKAPRPVGGYTETILRLIDLVFQAMAEAAPELTNGCAYGTINALSLAGYREDGRRWVMFSFFGGGHGGHPKGDGLNHGNAPISTATIPPLEILEAAYPVMFRQWALRADSGGAGKNRGGLGAVYEIELLEKSAEGFIFGERAKHAPPGVLGGKSAALNKFYFEQSEGDLTPPMGSKMVGIQLINGQAVRLESPGGGGYGDPLLRSIDAVTEDIRLGYITPENAQSEYGVALGPDGEIDVLTTQGKRNRTPKVETVS
jgi:N-methylhydantoinase B